MKIWKWLPWWCPFCRRIRFGVERRHRLTSYCEAYDECNWLTSCPDCFEWDTTLMAEQWADYWRGCL